MIGRALRRSDTVASLSYCVRFIPSLQARTVEITKDFSANNTRYCTMEDNGADPRPIPPLDPALRQPCTGSWNPSLGNSFLALPCLGSSLPPPSTGYQTRWLWCVSVVTVGTTCSVWVVVELQLLLGSRCLVSGLAR